MEEEIDVSLKDLIETLHKGSELRSFKLYTGEAGKEQFDMMLLIKMLEGDDRVPEHEKWKIKRLIEGKDKEARKLGLGIWENFKNKAEKEL